MGETIEDLARKTDFKNAQFAKEEVADKVVAQYDDGPTRVFYQITMGALPRPQLSPAFLYLHILQPGAHVWAAAQAEAATTSTTVSSKSRGTS